MSACTVQLLAQAHIGHDADEIRGVVSRAEETFARKTRSRDHEGTLALGLQRQHFTFAHRHANWTDEIDQVRDADERAVQLAAEQQGRQEHER